MPATFRPRPRPSREAAVLGAELLGLHLKLNARQVAKEVLEEFGRRRDIGRGNETEKRR